MATRLLCFKPHSELIFEHSFYCSSHLVWHLFNRRQLLFCLKIRAMMGRLSAKRHEGTCFGYVLSISRLGLSLSPWMLLQKCLRVWSTIQCYKRDMGMRGIQNRAAPFVTDDIEVACFNFNLNKWTNKLLFLFEYTVQPEKYVLLRCAPS